VSSGPEGARGRPKLWRCGRFTLTLERPLVMGILNVTPDSFSDGGLYGDVPAAVEHALRMADAGADIIEIGGESTRPGSDEVSPSEELARVLPVVEHLLGRVDVPLSIDTRHAPVARVCVEAGAAIMNDVSGFRDPAMVASAAQSDAGLVVMHMLGEPKTMQAEPHYGDVVAEVRTYLAAQAAILERAGVARERIVLDPGLGFGKTTAHNLELLRHLERAVPAGYPALVGASRKRFIGELTGIGDPVGRLGGSMAVALWAAERGAGILRVHDVAPTVQALRLWAALGKNPT